MRDVGLFEKSGFGCWFVYSCYEMTILDKVNDHFGHCECLKGSSLPPPNHFVLIFYIFTNYGWDLLLLGSRKIMRLQIGSKEMWGGAVCKVVLWLLFWSIHVMKRPF